ncbi:Methionine--tRNA ligase, cytoplasmic [Vitis vinifera]|uniref:Methionine--tRNA ligase, cytoplasmic n=1 Tax=Vitis vinifera TaxID=29760 RepID=A0A438IT49_VITVI|nr:Methionine--tRNA ligase, cytoplasmic [Vitis vinifera]
MHVYCETCQRFLADRLVEGTCPTLDCNYDSTRGDQCEKCGKLLNPTKLKNPRCKVCQSTPQIRGTYHLFLELSLLKDKLEEYINNMSIVGCWSQNAIQATYAWLKEGLRSTVMFPSTLIGAGENWTLMKSISVTEYLNYEVGTR